MQNALLDWIMPRNGIDAALKSVAVLGLVMMANIGFAEIYIGYQPVSLSYYVANTAFVGIPWLMIFVLVVSRQRAIERRLRVLSQTDGLTGLLNRNQFLEQVQSQASAGHRGTLLMLDADHFKSINDTYGHAAGDECLRNIARRLRNTLRGDDLAGRLGGEEFAIFLRDANITQAQDVSARLLRPIQFRETNGATQINATLSIGAVDLPVFASVGQQLALADKALYHAKAQGRACLSIWDANAHRPVVLGKTDTAFAATRHKAKKKSMAIIAEPPAVKSVAGHRI